MNCKPGCQRREPAMAAPEIRAFFDEPPNTVSYRIGDDVFVGDTLFGAGPRRCSQGWCPAPRARNPHQSAMKVAMVRVQVRRSSIEVRSSKPCAASPFGP